MDFSPPLSDKFMQQWWWIFTVSHLKRKCLGFIHQQWRGIGGEYKEGTGKSSTQITHPQQRILPLFFTAQHFQSVKSYVHNVFSQLVLTACFINVWYSTFYWPRADPYTVLRHGRAFNFYHRHYRADGRLLYCPTFSDKSGIINQISGDS